MHFASYQWTLILNVMFLAWFADLWGTVVYFLIMLVNTCKGICFYMCTIGIMVLIILSCLCFIFPCKVIIWANGIKSTVSKNPAQNNTKCWSSVCWSQVIWTAEMSWGAPPPEFLILQDWGEGNWVFAFLTSSQAILIPQAQRAHFLKTFLLLIHSFTFNFIFDQHVSIAHCSLWCFSSF
jgi:hypothetical protein